MKEVILLLIEVALPIVLGYVACLLKERKKDRGALEKGMMLLLRAKLIEYHKEWTDRGYITTHGIQNFLEMYEVYHSLGGNGMVTHLKEEVEKLDVK